MNSSEKYIDRIYEKVKIENFKGDILKNLRNNIKELFDNEFTIFKYKCEELVETSSLRYNKQIDHLQNEIKSKDKIIDQLIISLTNLTNSELESKSRIIHKLIDTNNNEENQHSVRHQHQIDKNVDAIKKKSVIPECSDSDKIVKLVRETCKDTKLCFSSLICRTDVPDIDENVIKTNTNLENYCNQQNIGFISNNNIKKSDLNARGLHLHERGSSKLAKNILDYLY